MIHIHPSLILLLGALLVLLLPKHKERLILIPTAVLSFASILTLPVGTSVSIPFINGMELNIIRVDSIAWLMLITALFMYFGAVSYGGEQMERKESVWSLIYAASTCGALLAGDFFSLIVWWEVMAIGASFMLISRNNGRAVRAGKRYLMVHFLGGNLLLFGIVGLLLNGTAFIGPLSRDMGLPYWLVLAGVGISAGMIPFNSWVPDAYPNSSITGSIIMSTFTTKVSAVTLIRLFAGEQFLLWMGIAMAFWGVFYALRESNMRRLLSYHIISQIGLIVAAIGIGNELALSGALALTIGNMVYKGLLYMCTGTVYYCTGKQNLVELGNQFKNMPAVAVFFAIGSLAIAGMPGLMGFACKPLILAAASHHHMGLIYLLLYAAGLGTFLSIPLKLGYNLFFAKPHRGEMLRRPTASMYFGMALASVIIIAIGVKPDLLYQFLPWAEGQAYTPWTLDHALAEFELFLGATITFIVLKNIFKPHASTSLDFDWFYRKPFPVFMIKLSIWITLICAKTWDFLLSIVHICVVFCKNPQKYFVSPVDGVNSEEFKPDKYRKPIGYGAASILLTFICVFWFVYLNVF